MKANQVKWFQSSNSAPPPSVCVTFKKVGAAKVLLLIKQTSMHEQKLIFSVQSVVTQLVMREQITHDTASNYTQYYTRAKTRNTHTRTRAQARLVCM